VAELTLLQGKHGSSFTNMTSREHIVLMNRAMILT